MAWISVGTFIAKIYPDTQHVIYAYFLLSLDLL